MDSETILMSHCVGPLAQVQYLIHLMSHITITQIKGRLDSKGAMTIFIHIAAIHVTTLANMPWPSALPADCS
jgi:hypothetical protein